MPRVLEHRVMPQDSTGTGAVELYGNWAAQTQCHLVVVHDPYLCAIRHASAHYPAVDLLRADNTRAATQNTAAAAQQP